LPARFTWLQIDGDGTDWDASLPAFDDVETDDESPNYDIQRVRAIRNDAFIYLLIETLQTPPRTSTGTIDRQELARRAGLAAGTVVQE
jgi:hypothetical protein